MQILTIIAHPDDETMLSGGALALLARAGAEVHYLCATRGEGGETGEPPLCEIEQLGSVRAAEMQCAVQALGGRGLRFMGYIDPRVGPDSQLHPYTQDFEGLLAQIQDAIQAIQPQAIITHGSSGEYGHPAHQLTHRAVRQVITELAETAAPGCLVPLLYTFSAAFPDHPRPRLVNANDPAHLVLDIRPALEQKAAAAGCHRTQHALFVRRSSQQAGRPLSVPEVIMPLEGLHRAYPPVTNGQLEDGLSALLKPWEYLNPGQDRLTPINLVHSRS